MKLACCTKGDLVIFEKINIEYRAIFFVKEYIINQECLKVNEKVQVPNTAAD